jgi:glutathione S-transferase
MTMIELYYFRNSVCSERVLMTLSEKGVTDWTPHHIDLFKHEQNDPAYLQLNPKAQVPTLVHDGHVIRESSNICNYIDDIFPGHPLQPENPLVRARMREWIKEADEAGFQGVAALSFATVFRGKVIGMNDNEREAMWSDQTDLSRRFRQRSCVNDGLVSPYSIIALTAWDSIFDGLEAELSDARTWILGETFSLADLNMAPLIARLEAMQLLDIWLDGKKFVPAWWQRIKSRNSYRAAGVGPSVGDELDEYTREGSRYVDEARGILLEHR